MYYHCYEQIKYSNPKYRTKNVEPKLCVYGTKTLKICYRAMKVYGI